MLNNLDLINWRFNGQFNQFYGRKRLIISGLISNKLITHKIAIAALQTVLHHGCDCISRLAAASFETDDWLTDDSYLFLSDDSEKEMMICVFIIISF